MNRSRDMMLSQESLAVIECVDAFERATLTEPLVSTATLPQFLSEVPPEHRRVAMLELVRVDLDRQWQHGHKRSVSDYLEYFPEMSACGADLLGLLADEYQLREQAQAQLGLEHYRQVEPSFDPGLHVAPSTVKVDATVPFEPLDDVEHDVPARIGKYLVVKWLGSGSFGDVYQGYDEQLRRSVAIKVPRRRSGLKGLPVDLLHEARVLVKIDHPGIVRLVDVSDDASDTSFVVYEFVDGTTLTERIRRGDYDFKQTAEWVAQIAEALHCAHQRKIYHRDLKPDNILIDQRNQAKVIDFGLARHNDDFYVRDEGEAVGTFLYMSPEQASGDSHWASSRADLYSLGAVFYTLLCRRPPFEAKGRARLIDQIIRRAPEPPRSLDPSIPPALENICLALLQKDATQRPRAGDEVAKRCRQALTPPSNLRWVIAASLLVLATSLGFLYASSSTAAPPPVLIKNAFALSADNGSPLEVLPLKPHQALEFRCVLDRPGYVYLFLYEQDGAARLLYPKDIESARPVQQLVYPDLDATPLELPNRDGASLLVALSTPNPLTRAETEQLLGERFALNITPQEAGTLEAISKIEEPLGQVDDKYAFRGESAFRRMQVPTQFKSKLKAHSDAYYGLIIPHQKDGETP